MIDLLWHYLHEIDWFTKSITCEKWCAEVYGDVVAGAEWTEYSDSSLSCANPNPKFCCRSLYVLHFSSTFIHKVPYSSTTSLLHPKKCYIWSFLLYPLNIQFWFDLSILIKLCVWGGVLYNCLFTYPFSCLSGSASPLIKLKEKLKRGEKSLQRLSSYSQNHSRWKRPVMQQKRHEKLLAE